MIILKSIRLRNFRAIREAVLNVPAEGILGLVGPNGAGKSTFLAGTLFALFGTKPNGASVSSLRRTNSGKEECSASVVFEHLNQTVEIIRELKGNNNRIIVDIFVDGVPQTVTSVGAADTWVAQRLGIDATGFLTAFIVRQKELDDLVTALPSKRKAVIEKLAGIDTINEALKKARKDENAAKAILESLPGSETKIDNAEAQVHLLSNKVNELTEVKEKKQGELFSLQEELTSLQSVLESFREQERKIFEKRNRLDSLTSQNKFYEETLAKLAYVSTVKEIPDVEILRERHRNVVQILTEKTQTLNVGVVKKNGVEQTIQAITESLSSLRESINNSVFSSGELPDVDTELQTVIEEMQDTRDKITVSKTKIADLQEKVVALTGDHKECPTCNTVLHDVDALVDGFKELASEYQNQQFAWLEKIDSLGKRKVALEETKRAITVFLQNVEQVSDLETKLMEEKQKLIEFPDFDVIRAELVDLEKEKDEITEQGFKARQLAQDKQEYEKAFNGVNQIAQELMQVEVELKDLTLTFTPEKYKEVRARQETVSREVNVLSNRMNEAYSELSGFQSRLSVANNELKSAVEQWKRKKELLSAQERKALTTELIDKFRKDSIASLAPELSDRATELISSITNGGYTEIRLDDSFNVSVINSAGEPRDVSWLSGGEESAVAFALRLAIAFLITGDNPSLLWLDEVLTAQDSDRRASMLSTIRSLPIDQILVINHTEEATDIVDNVVTVVPDITGGSVLVDGIVTGLKDKTESVPLDVEDLVSDPVDVNSMDEFDWVNQ